MKKVISIIFLIVTGISVNARSFSVFNDGLLDDIYPEGWLKGFLINQQEGMTGKPESMSYPYDSNLWDGEIVRNTETYGSDWWRYEQTAYYTDGLLRLAYLLDNPDLTRKAEAGIMLLTSQRMYSRNTLRVKSGFR